MSMSAGRERVVFKVLSILYISSCFLFCFTTSKWVEGHLKTNRNWAFLARFCFLSYDGQFEYQIEFSRDIGLPNLLLYYDDESQWPAVYRSNKSCQEREAVLNRAGQNQLIPLSHWYPESDFSGCVLKAVHPEQNNNATKKVPKAKSDRPKRPPKVYPKVPVDPNATTQDPRYFDQFLKSTESSLYSTLLYESTSAEVPARWNMSADVFDVETLEGFEEQLSSPGSQNHNDTVNMEDVEELFDPSNKGSDSIIRKRGVPPRSPKFDASPPRPGGAPWVPEAGRGVTLTVSCRNARRFKSVRERWWFIAISNCGENKGLDVKYRFLMTNGPPGDYWHEHFSADEFYVLPILMAFCFAYVLMMIALVMCSVELKARQLLHTTYKLFLLSVCLQQAGILLQSLAYVKYAVNGVGCVKSNTLGQLLCGLSEISYLLLLVLMAKGYTITRARLKVAFTVKLTVFICNYFITYISLFVYQAKEFDPGEVLYLYESPAGYGLIVLRILAWFMFVYAIVFTIKKYPEKSIFYYPFSMCGTLWFYAGPLFILTANNYIDKWVRESVVTAVLLFITFCGHVSFLLLTLPVFANKNFPYHVRTTQIGIMEVQGGNLDQFGHSVYQPSSQPIIIPLSRRTEELLGATNHYLATAPPLYPSTYIHSPNIQLSNGNGVSHISGNLTNSLPTQENNPNSLQIHSNAQEYQGNVGPKLSISTQHSAESVILDNNQKNLEEVRSDSLENRFVPPKTSDDNLKLERDGGLEVGEGDGKIAAIFTVNADAKSCKDEEYNYKNDPDYIRDINNPFLISASFKARRGLLEPIARKDAPPPPAWTLAKRKSTPQADKNHKDTVNGIKKTETVDYHLQGVIGTFPLPQIPRNAEKIKETNLLEEEADKLKNNRETNKSVEETNEGQDSNKWNNDNTEDSLSMEESLHVLQSPGQRIDDTTMALYR